MSGHSNNGINAFPFSRRCGLESRTELVMNVNREKETVPEILAELESNVSALWKASITDENWCVPSMRVGIMDVIQQIEEQLTNPGAIQGLATGFRDFDRLSGGFFPGELVVLGARPGMGKCSLALNMILNVAMKQEIPTAFFSLDSSRQMVIYRMLCMEAFIPLHKLRTGLVSPKRDLPKLMSTAGKLADIPLWIDDTLDVSMVDIYARARRLKRDHDIRFLVVDYLQLLRSDPRKTYENRSHEIRDVCAGLQRLAREFDLTVLVTSQLNRQCESRPDGGRPRMSDLRESGVIETLADKVMLLFREAYYAEDEEDRMATEGWATLILAKNRNGPTGDVGLRFRSELMRFEDRDEEEGWD